ncbi:caspase family protein [bacterium]|nr:caspase family protein [bacterium]
MKNTLLGMLLLTGLCLAQPGSSPRLLLPVPHSLPICVLSQSSDGRFLASADVSGAIKIWDQSEKQLRQTLLSPRGMMPMWLDWLSPDRLACYGNDFRYHTYDVSTGQLLKSQPEKPYRSQGGLAQAGGKIYLCPAKSDPLTLECWEPLTWKKQGSWKIPEALAGDSLTSLTLNSEGSRACLALSGGKVLEMSLDQGKLKWLRPKLPDSLWLAGYGPDGKTVAASGPQGIYLLDATSVRGPFGSKPDQRAHWVDGKIQYLSGKRLCQLDPAHPEIGGTVGSTPVPENMAQATGDHHLLLGTMQGRVVDAQNGQAVFAEPQFSPIRVLTYDDKGNLFAGLSSGQVVCWSLQSGKREKVLEGRGRVQGLTLSGDGRVLVVSRADDAKLEIYDTASLTVKATLTLSAPGLIQLRCSQDGRFLAGLREGKLEVYDLHRQQLLNLPALLGQAGFAMHPSQPVLAVAGSREIVEIHLLTLQRTSYTNYNVGTLAYNGQGQLFGLGLYPPDRLRLVPIVAREITDIDFPAGTHDYALAAGSGHSFFLNYDLGSKGWLMRNEHGGCFVLGDQLQARRLLPDGGSWSSAQFKSLANGIFPTVGREYTVEFWKAGEDSPRGQLLALDKGAEWLVTDRSGLFDGTPEAERQVEWYLDNRKVRVDQLFEKAYRPGLLKSFLRGASSGGESSAPGLQIVPPQVSFVSPLAETQVAQRIIDVRVSVQDQGGGVADPKLFVNGKAVAQKPRNIDGDWLFQAPLQPGVNDLRCTAMDKSGTVESRGGTLRLTCTAAISRNPKLLVIAVGLNQAGSASKLSFAETDAKTLSEKLKSPLFEACDVRLLAGDQARTDSLKTAFEDLAKEAQSQDTLVLFLAGHGTADAKGYRFLMAPGQPDLEGSTLTRWLREFPAQKQFVILDTCHAGAVSDELAASFAINQQRMARGSGVYLLAACRSDQSALELPSLKHGLLTYTLLEGLKSAPPNSRQQLTVNGLVYYVCNMVPDLCRQVGLNQDVFQFVSGTDFPIRVNSKP